MRSQAAPLPSMLARCAHLHATGQHDAARAVEPAAIIEAQRMIAANLTRRRVPIDDRADLQQDATIKTLRELRRGIQPTISTVTYHCVVDAYRKQHTRGRSREPIPVPASLDAIEEPIAPERESEDDSAARLLGIIGAESPMLALVAQYALDGMTERQIATATNQARSEARSQLARIRVILEAEIA